MADRAEQLAALQECQAGLYKALRDASTERERHAVEDQLRDINKAIAWWQANSTTEDARV